MPELTQEYLKSLIEYVPETGDVFWKVSRNSYGGGVRPGEKATNRDKRSGHMCIGIDGKLYQLHRIIWFYVMGRWPNGQIDHKNMCPTDNRWDNLREASMTQQRANQRVRRDSQLGVKGVRKYRNKFNARIKGKSLGYFDTVEKAAAAYESAAKAEFGDFARAS